MQFFVASASVQLPASATSANDGFENDGSVQKSLVFSLFLPVPTVFCRYYSLSVFSEHSPAILSRMVASVHFPLFKIIDIALSKIIVIHLSQKVCCTRITQPVLQRFSPISLSLLLPINREPIHCLSMNWKSEGVGDRPMIGLNTRNCASSTSHRVPYRSEESSVIRNGGIPSSPTKISNRDSSDLSTLL